MAGASLVYAPPRLSPVEMLLHPSIGDPTTAQSALSGYVRIMEGGGVPEAIPVDDEEIAEHWWSIAVERIADKRDLMLVFTGQPGDGKSTASAWFLKGLARRLRDDLGLPTTFDLTKDIAHTPGEFVRRLNASSPSCPTLTQADEAVLSGFQSRSGTNDVSLELDKDLTIDRYLQPVAALLIPSISRLAAFARQGRIAIWFHVERRGVMTAFTFDPSLKFYPDKRIPYNKAPRPWHRLHFPSIENWKEWAPYETDKERTIHQQLEFSASRLEAIEGRGKEHRDETPQEARRRRTREGMRKLRARQKERSKGFTGEPRTQDARAREPGT